MTQSSNLQNFLESLMQIQVNYMGGASAGIIGSLDVNSDTVDKLKKCSVIFAKEYETKKPNQAELATMAEKITSYLLALQITNTISEGRTQELIDSLEILMTEAPA